MSFGISIFDPKRQFCKAFPNTCRNRIYNHIKVVVCKKPLEKTTNIPDMRPFWKSAILQRLQPLQNCRFGSKIKIPKKYAKIDSTTTLRIVLCKKPFEKTPNITDMRQFWKSAILHNAKLQNCRLCCVVGRVKQKIGFINWVEKGWIATGKVKKAYVSSVSPLSERIEELCGGRFIWECRGALPLVEIWSNEFVNKLGDWEAFINSVCRECTQLIDKFCGFLCFRGVRIARK